MRSDAHGLDRVIRLQAEQPAYYFDLVTGEHLYLCLLCLLEARRTDPVATFHNPP